MQPVITNLKFLEIVNLIYKIKEERIQVAIVAKYLYYT